MTTAQKKGLEYALAILAVALTAAFSAGISKRDLDDKEDSAKHAADFTAVRAEARDSITAEKNARVLEQSMRAIRDSAWRDRIERRVTDVACDLNPKRRYCGASQ